MIPRLVCAERRACDTHRASATLATKPDLLSILEAGYAVDAAEEPWLQRLLEAARPSLDEGLGAFAFSYETPDPRSFALRCLTSSGIPDGVRNRLPTAIAEIPETYVENARNDQTCIVASQIPGFGEFTAIPKYLHEVGAYDVFGINVRDTTGIGCYLGAPLPRLGQVTRARRATWERVAAHVASAFRLQRRFEPSGASDGPREADAVLDGSGKVHHAVGAAELKTAREALRTATTAMESARTKLRREEPERALENWKGLVAARWSLVEHFESDGKRYILARRNDPDVTASPLLTKREQQIVGYAALGHESKLIAYELGISDSTVRVLLSRAAAKLGARSRAELIATFLAATDAAPKPHHDA
jgi:DNA-binding CsgD family transcriptional regulator